MNIKQLKFFLSIAEHGSIAAAARTLDVAQPALSIQISKLEHEVGADLFTRGHGGVQLTDAGELFHFHAASVVQQMEQALGEISDLNRSIQGTFVVAMNQATDNILALPLFKALEKKYPGVDLDLRTGLSYDVKKLLSSGEADLAIIYEDGQKDPDIIKYPLIKENLFFVCKPGTLNQQGKEIDFAALVDHEIVMTSEKESLGYITARYEKSTGISLRKKRPYGQLLTGLRFSAQGLCNIILPSSAFYHLEERGEVQGFKIVNPEVLRDVYLAVDARKPLRLRTIKMMEVIRECVQQENLVQHWIGTPINR
ncbi:LysR family transcriptional regulator [Marinobacterium zhoushanense]|uniref:LysR family transcriptional regulator n=1 Tax=Marinobacterium zhoushanense TaxID=1679163 RepID=A0ABQ1JY03_9GAMM|nr:LysR family transcriptional regulator [Marinobacterium zhoushanense]GGB80096.1 LysR family transcriptional regulator [Marinobacterium zhoushanense]